jgi:hypothetical protein
MQRDRVSGDMSGPDWVMVHQTSGRRDFRFYGLLAVGLVFVYAGATVDPATNCSSGGECAPWLVPIAFWMGVIASLGGAAGILRNPRRGSRINARTGELEWWDEVHSPEIRSLRLSDVSAIHVDPSSDASTVRLLDAKGDLMPFPGVEVMPWRFEDWARGVAKIYPHIRLDVAP